MSIIDRRFCCVIYLACFCIAVSGLFNGQREKKNHLEREGPVGPSAFYTLPIETFDEVDYYSPPVRKSNIDQFQSKKHSLKKSEKKKRKHIEKPVRLFRRVINVLKKRSHRPAILFPHYYILPRHSFFNTHMTIKKTTKHGKLTTDISTKKFHINITDKSSKKVRRDKKDLKTFRRSHFIAADDREDETAEQPNDVSPQKLIKKKFFATETFMDPLSKLRKQRIGLKAITRATVNNNDSSSYFLGSDENVSPLLKSIQKGRKKKKRLTKLFVRFMEDMTNKLQLNPLTVAKLMVHRIADKRSLK